MAFMEAIYTLWSTNFQMAFKIFFCLKIYHFTLIIFRMIFLIQARKKYQLRVIPIVYTYN